MISPKSIDGRTSLPASPEGAELSEAELPLRFEDITQDARLQLVALLPGLGATGWRALMKEPYTKTMLRSGIVPLLTRIVMQAEDGPFSVNGSLRYRGSYGFSHVLGANGEVERLQLAMWLEAELPIGRTYGAAPANAGERTLAGRVYAEHTLTRPFGPKEERRVRRLEVEGLEAVPGQALEPMTVADNARLPLGATLLDPAPLFDSATTVFGVGHTDSNQHVNSLVYVRLFEEAALRRFALHGRPSTRLLRQLQIGYRKPCFAGESVRFALQAFEQGGRVGALGALLPASVSTAEDVSRAHAYVSGWFD